MTDAQILKEALIRKEQFREGDFFIGSVVDEVLPNGKVSKLVCVDADWLSRSGQKPILSKYDLDEVETIRDTKSSNSMQITDYETITLVKWRDLIDNDGDFHHCKVVTYITIEDDAFKPINEDGIDTVIFVEV